MHGSRRSHTNKSMLVITWSPRDGDDSGGGDDDGGGHGERNDGQMNEKYDANSSVLF